MPRDRIRLPPLWCGSGYGHANRLSGRRYQYFSRDSLGYNSPPPASSRGELLGATDSIDRPSEVGRDPLLGSVVALAHGPAAADHDVAHDRSLARKDEGVDERVLLA